tara:strand:- start:1156 stop:1512 length:357 start_codon:yes stop_codon:yes gene_type:complete
MKLFNIIILTGLLFSFGCTTEEYYTTIYTDEDQNKVTISVTYYRVSGGMIHEARGKVKNHGPESIAYTRVYLISNYAESKMVPSKPAGLLPGESGDWELFNLPGTSIQQKTALYDIWQ